MHQKNIFTMSTKSKKYKITTMSILRITNSFDRYDLAKIFDEYLN